MATTTYKPPAGTKVYENGKLYEVASGSTSYNTKLFTFSDGGGSSTPATTSTKSSSSSSSPAPSTPTPTPVTPTPTSAPSQTFNSAGRSIVGYVDGKPIYSGTDAEIQQQYNAIKGGGGSSSNSVQPTNTQISKPSQAVPPKTNLPSSVNPQQTGANTEKAATGGQLTLPQSGSVVDLLNSVGADSSFAARSQLAAQYGIQSYQGTAAQNQQLAKKYIEAYNANKGSSAPQTGAEARATMSEYLSETEAEPLKDPISSFFDSYSSLDPVLKAVYDSIGQINSYLNNKTSLQEEIMGLPEFQERADVKAELLDLRRVMDGSEEDIREEIERTGGFATESQVQALTSARNKVLLKKANALTDQFNVLNDYVNQVAELTQADRAEVEKDMQTRLGLATTMLGITQQMNNAARENMQGLVSQIGYNGLASMLQNSPKQMRQAEKTLGLPSGALSNPAFLQAATPMPKLTTQITEIDGRKALLTFDGTGNPVNLVDLGPANAPGSGELTPGQVNAFNSIVSKYNASPLIAAADRTAVLSATIKNIKKDPSNGAQQLNLAYSYIQALDTYQSAVREGELSLVNSIDSRIGQLQGEITKIQNGQIVRPEVALQIAAAAETIVGTINQAAKQKAQSFASQANVVGLGPYWNQYVSGFNQGYNQTSGGNSKGVMSSAQFVEQTLNGRGKTYQQVLDAVPFGQIGVIDNETGEVGSIPPEEFDPELYTRI